MKNKLSKSLIDNKVESPWTGVKKQNDYGNDWCCGVNFYIYLSIAQPEFGHMVYEATWYQTPRNKWCTISTCSVWWWFECHTVLLKNPRMRDRIHPFICATTGVLVTEVRYYHKCWLKRITNRALTDEKMIHMQNITVREVQEIVFHHVQEMIFGDHETRKARTP